MPFTVTCKELPGLIRDLRKVDPELAKQLKAEIRRVERPGQQAMAQSALAATTGPMKKASHAVKPSNRYTGKSAQLSIKIDAGIAPNARPLDKPNNGDTNRHPVWGHRWRVNQPAHFFFDRGSVKVFDMCREGMDRTLDAVVRFLGRG